MKNGALSSGLGSLRDAKQASMTQRAPRPRTKEASTFFPRGRPGRGKSTGSGRRRQVGVGVVPTPGDNLGSRAESLVS